MLHLVGAPGGYARNPDEGMSRMLWCEDGTSQPVRGDERVAGSAAAVRTGVEDGVGRACPNSDLLGGLAELRVRPVDVANERPDLLEAHAELLRSEGDELGRKLDGLPVTVIDPREHGVDGITEARLVLIGRASHRVDVAGHDRHPHRLGGDPSHRLGFDTLDDLALVVLVLLQHVDLAVERPDLIPAPDAGTVGGRVGHDGGHAASPFFEELAGWSSMPT